MIIDGCGASSAWDKSGERLCIEGLDISSVKEGTVYLNWEHKGPSDAGSTALDTVGKVIYAHKIFKASDCENDRQKDIWNELSLPFCYIIGRIDDEAGNPGSVAIAALIRSELKNEGKITIGLSVEGSTLQRENQELKQSVARAWAITCRPCNTSSKIGLLSDPAAPPGFDKSPVEKPDLLDSIAKKSEEILPNGLFTLGSHERNYNPILSEEELNKTITAGSYNAAPGTLTGGAALQVEDQSLHRAHLKNQLRAAVRDWDQKTPIRKHLEKYLAGKLPEPSDEYLDNFANMVEDFRIKKAQVRSEDPDLFKPLEKMAPPGPSTAENLHPADDEPDEDDEDPSWVNESNLTIRGKPTTIPNIGKSSHFDSNTGILHTPKGSFPMHIPGRDQDPRGREGFANALADEKPNSVHAYAMKNWRRAHELLKAGRLPDAVIMHSALHGLMSANTPVKIQELMYSLDGNTILQASNGIYKEIKDFKHGDKIFGVDENGRQVENLVVALHDHGILEGFEATFDDGYNIVCSRNHKFLTPIGQQPLHVIASYRLEILSGSYSKDRWLVEPLRAKLSDRGQVQGTSEGLSGLQGHSATDTDSQRSQDVDRQDPGRKRGYFTESSGWKQKMAGREPRPGYERVQGLEAGESGSIRPTPEKGVFCYGPMAKGTSRRVQRAPARNYQSRQILEGRKSRRICGKCQQFGFIWEKMAGGESRKIWKNSREIKKFYFEALDIGNRKEISGRFPDIGGVFSDILWRKKQVGRLCKSRSQNLGGSRWILAFFCGLTTETPPSQRINGSSGKRRNVESGSLKTSGCNIDSNIVGMFFQKNKKTQRRMANMAYSDAPLAQTGSLVRRRIVRVRAVGPRHMYDLEVSHPKHNFLLPNGVVTSNSHAVDEINQHGIDPRSDRFSQRRASFLERDRAKGPLPQHSRQYFEGLGNALKVGGDEAGHTARLNEAAGRKPGDIMAFQLAGGPGARKPGKIDYASKYHKVHDQLVNLLQHHGHDAQAAVEDMMNHKAENIKWNNQRKKELAAGMSDRGEFPGMQIPGIAPKIARYMMGMLGGGNITVNDTHFTRHLFGLDKGLDTGSIKYLKGVLSRHQNSHLLNAIDDYYNKNHDAIQHVKNMPELRGVDDRDLTFPAFWRHWMAIVPHEKARGMQTLGYNEFTSHKPYWDAIERYIQDEENKNPKLRLVKHDQDAMNVAIEAANKYHYWVEHLGEPTAQILYWAVLAPKLLGNAETENIGPDANGELDKIGKFERLAVDLAIVVDDLRKSKKEAEADKPPETVTFQGQKVKPGKISMYASGDPVGIGNKKIQYHVIGHDDNNFFVIPHGNYTWQPDEVKKLARLGKGVGYNVDRWPEYVGSDKLVNASVHGHSLNRTPEQVKLIHGLDVGKRKLSQTHHEQELGHGGAKNEWRKGPAGVVLLKGDEKIFGFPQSHKEVAYANVARDVFGLGQFLPTTAMMKHPITGQETAVIQKIKGAHHVDWDDPEQKQQMRDLHNNGTLDKLGLMDFVLGNPDRHEGNYMMSPEGIKLIDPGLAFSREDGRQDHLYLDEFLPHFLGQMHNNLKATERIHPDVGRWIRGISPEVLAADLVKSGVPQEHVTAALHRLSRIHDFYDLDPNGFSWPDVLDYHAKKPPEENIKLQNIPRRGV